MVVSPQVNYDWLQLHYWYVLVHVLLVVQQISN